MGVALFRVVGSILIALCMGASTASARPQVDWERGLLVATAAAPADLRSPTTQLARVKAERIAIKRCSALLRKAASSLPMASGKTAGASLGETLVSAEIGLIPLKTDQGSDGSVVVTMALPIDRLRTLHVGADRPAKAAQATPILVDARSLKIAPTIGVGVEVEGAVYHGPVLFFRDETSARALLGNAVHAVRAKSAKLGVLRLKDGFKADTSGVPLVVVLYSQSQ